MGHPLVLARCAKQVRAEEFDPDANRIEGEAFMKKNGILVVAACVAALGLAAQAMGQAAPAKPAVKGEVVADVVKKTATVVSIDMTTREVALKGEDGKVFTVVVDQAAKNLDQVKPGDVVVAAYAEALAYEVNKSGAAAGPGAGTSTSLKTAKPGEKPAGVITQKTTLTATVTAIDPKAPSVTLKGPGGNAKTIKVKDAAKLQGVKVGDSVDITYTEAIAISVEKAPVKK
jgi:Cu/Ag efflux protein CusF